MREETLLTGRAGRLHGRLWTADDDTKGVVIIVHGLGDHSGRYQDVARQLTQDGWSVFAFDQLGHGLSPGTRGRADRYDGLLSDIAEARQTIAARLPDARQVIVGHSMGGNLAMNYVLRRNHLRPIVAGLAGLSLCGPMLLPPTPPPRPHIFAAWMTGHLFPWIRVGRPVDVSLLTQEPSQAASISADPMMHCRISIYLATQLLSQGRWALDHAREVDVPTLVMLGDDDQLIDKSACQHVVIRIGPLATFVNWPATRHDLFHETQRNAIIKRLSTWLDQLR